LGLSEEQERICDQVVYDKKLFSYGPKQKQRQSITIAGYAGTGKTYLIAEIAKRIRALKTKRFKIAFCCFTGKASSVLRKRLMEADAIKNTDYAGTIHGLIYKPRYGTNENGQQVIVGWNLINDIEQDLIIVDEVSMVNRELWNDLKSFGVPIIAVGDHGQLPPIGDNFNILNKPHHVLTEIHRQAADNPIIKLSMDIRNNGSIPFGQHSGNGSKVYKFSWKHRSTQDLFNSIQWTNDYIILCGFNATRVNLNNMIRAKYKYTLPEPYPDERLICLKNNHSTKVMNGQLGTTVWFSRRAPQVYEMTLSMDDLDGDYYTTLIHNYCFGKESYDGSYEEVKKKKQRTILKRTGYDTMDLFDYGYCISVHRSQGSEWPNVVLFEQRSKHWDYDYYKRWLYTAITRAKQNLFIISDFW